MSTQEQPLIQAYLSVRDAKQSVYVSEDTTRAIVNDCWLRIEETVQELQAAMNATADAPHERILSVLQAAQEIARHADVIYAVTPLPDTNPDDYDA